MKQSNLQIGLFGAFERHNFGDWLMAYCASKLLEQRYSPAWIYDFDNFGKGINRDCGSYIRLDQFLSISENPLVIHIGGETLACSSGDAARMASNETINELARPLHYVLPNSLNGVALKRTFFGTGGTGVSGLSRQDVGTLEDSLKSASWVSVRDRISFQNLQDLGINPILHPDIVSMISSIHPLKDFIPAEKSKLVFQISSSLLSSRLEETCDTLLKHFHEFESVKLVVAGIALGHDSLESYLELANLVNTRRKNWISILFDLDPLKIVEEIATAKLVIATSLHFRIVAMSYGVPRISMFVQKTLNYAENWDLAEFGVNEYGQFGDMLNQLGNFNEVEFREIGVLRSNEVVKNWSEMMQNAGK